MEEEKVLEKFRIFGENVRKYRLQKIMTIKELSEKTGITERHLNRIENGTAKRLNVSHIFNLAKSLGILPHELCKGI